MRSSFSFTLRHARAFCARRLFCLASWRNARRCSLRASHLFAFPLRARISARARRGMRTTRARRVKTCAARASFASHFVPTRASFAARARSACALCARNTVRAYLRAALYQCARALTQRINLITAAAGVRAHSAPFINIACGARTHQRIAFLSFARCGSAFARLCIVILRLWTLNIRRAVARRRLAWRTAAHSARVRGAARARHRASAPRLVVVFISSKLPCV